MRNASVMNINIDYLYKLKQNIWTGYGKNMK